MLVTVEQPNKVQPVSNGTPGDEIRRRREAMGWSVKALAAKAGVDRGRLADIERGATARGSTLGAIEAALAEIEEETGHDEPADEGMVTFRLSGNFGVDVVVQGPVTNLSELEASVERLVQSMKKDPPEKG